MSTPKSLQSKLKGRKFHVYIVESPGSHDLYDRRSEGEALQKTLRLSGIQSSYHLAIDKQIFSYAFRQGLINHYKNAYNYDPIIHISAHGDQNGIGLTNGERINWNELRQYLQPLNNVLKGGLLLSMSSCFGLSGCKMSMLDNNYPCAAIIGSHSSPTWGETNIAYAVFYHLFRRGLNLQESIKRMNEASDAGTFMAIHSKTSRSFYLDNVNRSAIMSEIRQNIPKN